MLKSSYSRSRKTPCITPVKHQKCLPVFFIFSDGYTLREMNAPEFEKRYGELNAEQKMAVDTIDGPVMVIAGPGTGKTKTLTMRIANIVKMTDTEPENILALTFTRAGVVSMRKALIGVMGADAYSVAINTFHGFAESVIRDNPECFPNIIGSEPLADSDKYRIFEEIFESLPLEHIRSPRDKFYYLPSAISAISDLKREGVDPENFRAILAEDREAFESIEDLYSERKKGAVKVKYASEEKRLQKNEELALVYEAYESKLGERQAYDYNDMIMETLKALASDKNLLLSLQEKYQYILADEHQDSNNSQNRILELLADYHENPNLFIVGDAKQAIYRFQGASLENFEYFKKRYQGVKLIEFKSNYRSTGEILSGAYSVIKRDSELESKSGKGEKIRIGEFASELAEEYFVADEIKKKLDSGADAEEIAVLYRENKDSSAFAEAFRKYGIPFVVESDNNLLSDPDVARAVKIMKAVYDPADQFSVVEAAHMSCFGLDPIEIYKTLSGAQKNRVHVLDAIKESENEKMREFGKKISGWKIISKNESLMDTVEAILTESGMMEDAMKRPDRLARIERLSEFYAHVRSFAEGKKGATFDDFMEHIRIMEGHNAAVGEKKSGFTKGKVRLMTTHGSKGQEFRSVYLVRATDNKWGKGERAEKIRLPYRVYSLTGRITEEEEKKDDNRKLFYVALTRAKKELTITYSKEKDGKEQLPAEFISEIREDMTEAISAEKWDSGTDAYLKVLFSMAPKTEPEEEIKKLVNEALDEKGLSATDINNYLDCPWRYFYSGLFRIPEKQKPHLSYGTAVHAALKEFFDSIKEHGPRKDYLLSRFEYHLSRSVLEPADEELLLKTGRESLSAYFEERKEDWEKDFITEFKISGVEIAPNVKIQGRIDRMEQLGFSDEVIVTDFKTGRAKSAKEIAGETKNSDGNIKRQLVFYKLLLDGYKEGKYKMVSGQIDFIDPDASGKCRSERVPVSAEEAEALKEEIIRIDGEIRSLAFWNKRCDDKDCPHCKLRESVRLT